MIDKCLENILHSLAQKYHASILISSETSEVILYEGEQSMSLFTKVRKLVKTKLGALDFSYLDTTPFVSFDFIYKDTITYSAIVSPICPYIQIEDFIEFLSTLYYLLTQLPLPDIPSWIRTQSSQLQIHTITKENRELWRTHDSNLDSIEFEQRFLNAVVKNERHKIEWMISKIQKIYLPKLAKDNHVNIKFKCVALITLLTRISINEGAPRLSAYTLSDTLIQSLECISTPKGFINFIHDGTLAFMDLIHTFPYRNKSIMVREILLYIDNNLYNKIHLQDIAEAVGAHQTSVSATFKKEMKETVHTYINRKKVLESKHLLILTNKSYSDIATSLNFSTQSHYIHIFKKFEKMTPSEYRTLNKRKYLDGLTSNN